MKKYLLITQLLLLTQFAFSQSNPIPSIKKWIVGNWKTSLPKGYIVETWSYENDSTLKSTSHIIKPNGDSILQETVNLEYKKSITNYVVTTADQNDNLPVSFKLIKNQNNKLIFENPKHDFPQRITYKLISKNKILAWIEGTIKGKFKKKEFEMERIVN
jgi:hypothetical protein